MSNVIFFLLLSLTLSVSYPRFSLFSSSIYSPYFDLGEFKKSKFLSRQFSSFIHSLIHSFIHRTFFSSCFLYSHYKSWLNIFEDRSCCFPRFDSSQWKEIFASSQEKLTDNYSWLIELSFVSFSLTHTHTHTLSLFFLVTKIHIMFDEQSARIFIFIFINQYPLDNPIEWDNRIFTLGRSTSTNLSLTLSLHGNHRNRL